MRFAPVFSCTVPIFLFAQQAERSRTIFLLFRYREYLYASACCEQIRFGRVGCNGLVYIRNGEAVIMDTPPDSVQSLALLRWIEKRFPGTIVKAVVVSHFHDDCLHRSARLSPERHSILCQCKNKNPCCRKRGTGPQNGFPVNGYNRRWTKIKPVFGEAHTDNIVTWIPSETSSSAAAGKIFGQCKRPGRCQCRWARLPAG